MNFGVNATGSTGGANGAGAAGGLTPQASQASQTLQNSFDSAIASANDTLKISTDGQAALNALRARPN